MSSNKAVIGLVSSVAEAEKVLNELERAGFSTDDISALFPDKTGTRDFAHVHHTKAPEGAVAGVSAGGAIGGTLGLLAGVGALSVSGLGPFVAAGPILSALSGAAAGAAVGGITGALIGMGVPEIEARQYEGKLERGSILLSVHVDDAEQRDRAKNILERHGAVDITVATEKSLPASQRARSLEHRA
jgi:hypothetical protein